MSSWIAEHTFLKEFIDSAVDTCWEENSLLPWRLLWLSPFMAELFMGGICESIGNR